MVWNLYKALIGAKTSSDVEQIIGYLGDKIKWIPVGNNPGNYGIISMGSEPFDGITERITNAIDAMIELEAELNSHIKNCVTPREAIEKIYNIRDGNLRFAEKNMIGELASNIKIKFLDSEKRKAPTIEIFDKGIGQHPTDFPNTLLGLNRDYKVSKFYLIGAFGQGGQTSFQHCNYGIIISRKHPKLLSENQNDMIGWSIVRYTDPSTEKQFYKRGFWEYCVNSKNEEIMEIKPNKMPIAFDNGTIIRLIAYDLPRGVSDVLQPSGTAWGFLSQSLFDPILPIRLFEKRKDYQSKNRPLSGLAPRLWSGGKGEKVHIDINNSYKIDLRDHGKITLNYWALAPAEESGWRDVKKGFVTGNSCIFTTLNGQRHGVESATFLRDNVNLKYSYDYIIIQLDCDGLTNFAKKYLFSSTRDRLKEGEMKNILMQEVARHLRNDRNILAFEKQRRRDILSAGTHRDTSKIKRLVGKYISKNPELSDLILKAGKETIKGMKQPKKIVEEEELDEEIDEQELEIPELKDIPSYIKVANIKEPIPIEKGGSALVRLEIDAKDVYLEGENEDRFRCIHQSNFTYEKSRSKLRNGKLSYYIYCPTNVRIGSKEILTFKLDVPDKSNLSVEREIVVVKPFKRRKIKSEKKVPEPKIIEVRKKNEDLWNRLGYDENSVGEIRLAGKDSAILISIENTHLQNVLKKYILKESSVEEIKNKFVAAISYYLLLREVDKIKRKGEIQFDESPSSNELQRLAHTISLLVLPTGVL